MADELMFTHNNKNISRIHSSTKLPPSQASFKKNEDYAYRKLLDKPKNVKPKYGIGDLT